VSVRVGTTDDQCSEFHAAATDVSSVENQSDVIVTVIQLDQLDPAAALRPMICFAGCRFGFPASPPTRYCTFGFQQLVTGLLMTTSRVPPVNVLLLTNVLQDLST
jgi:hypothetical protein